MKKVLLVGMLLFSIMSFAQSLKDLDTKNGFRDDIFGTPVESYNNLKLMEESKDGYSKYYQKTDEKTTVGNFEIYNVYYVFYKGKLETVTFNTKGFANSKGIFDILKANYGAGRQSNKYIEEYYWLGKTVMMAYDENSLNHDAKILITTDVNSAEKEKDKKESIEKVKI